MIEDIIQQESPKEEIIEVSSSDVGKIEEVVEIPESVPGIETETEADEKEEKVDAGVWAPLEDSKILEQLERIDRYILKMLPVESYNAKGKSSYTGYSMKDHSRRTILNIRPNKSKATLRYGTIVEDKSKFKTLRITESGLFEGEDKVTLPELLKRLKSFVSEKGW